MKKKTKQPTSSISEDTIPLLSEYDGDIKESRASDSKSSTKSPIFPSIRSLQQKLKSKDNTSSKETLDSSSRSSTASSDPSIDSGASTSSSRTSVRKGIKAVVKKAVTAFDRRAKKEQAPSLEPFSPPSKTSSSWYTNPLGVSDLDEEPAYIKHWAPVEDLLGGDEFDAFVRSRASSTSASSDFEFRPGGELNGAIGRLDSIAEPVYENIDQFQQERAGTAKGPTVASQTTSSAPKGTQAGNRGSQQVVINGSIYDVPDPVAAYDTPRNLQPVAQNAAASREPTYDTPRNSQIVAQQQFAASAKPATSAPKPPVPPRTAAAPAAAPRKVLNVGEQKSAALGNVGSVPSAQQPTQKAVAPVTKAESSTAKTTGHTTASAKLVTAQPFRGEAATLKSVTPPVAAPRKVFNVGEQKSAALGNVGSVPSAQQPAQKAVAPVTKAESSAAKTADSSLAPAKSAAAQPLRSPATSSLKPAVPPKPVTASTVAPREALGGTKAQTSSPVPQNMGSVHEHSKDGVPSIQQRKAMLAGKIGSTPERSSPQGAQRFAQSESATARTTDSALASAKLMTAQPFRRSVTSASKPVAAPVATSSKTLGAGEQKSSPVLQNMSSMPEYSKNVVPGVQQRKAMLAGKVSSTPESSSQNTQRSAQSESTAREIQDIRSSISQTREARAAFASQLDTLLASNSAPARETVKAGKSKVTTAKSPATAQTDVSPLRGNAAKSSTAPQERANTKATGRSAPSMDSGITQSSVATQKQSAAPEQSTHKGINSRNPAFADELQKVLGNRIGASNIEKPVTAASKTLARQASVQKRSAAPGSGAADANAARVSKISANPAFAGAIPTLERMLAERQSTQQAERVIGGHSGAQKALGSATTFPDTASAGEQSAHGMSKREAVGGKSPASAKKEGTSASTPWSEGGEAQTKKGKHVSSLIRGFESPSGTPPVRGAAR
ncbi:hypothetical protein ACIS_00832 [Anaplasma centrale str. Israel]|uniref:Uncharacterized protein n=1 Tax=Anaplasma centrale (strain Israel) TaxID=574556 RepID=D1ASB5_ANACI|nr:hypothetical protein [Anaplasma centrale]ACZ49368.1 hypothetical protein ACIS_00832 [Anaplasma centrale str. Israel]